MGTTAVPSAGGMQTGDAQSGIARIRTRLLDLTSRNKLINFRHPRTSSLRFVDTGLDNVFEALLNGAEIEIHSLPEEPNTYDDSSLFGAEPTDSHHDPTASAKNLAIAIGWKTEPGLPETGELPARLRTILFRADFERIAKKITTTAHTSLEESGANTLFLCFGFLRWKDADGDQFLESPLVVLPVSIERKKSQRAGGWSYELSYSGEDFTTNLSLSEKLKELGIELPVLGDEEVPSNYLGRIREVVSEKPGWEVRTYLTLALLSFGKLLMYLDLDPRRWPTNSQITDHKIIRTLFEGREDGPSSPGEEYDIDNFGQRFVPPLFYDADSSQHTVLIDSLADRNIVVEGPPGTGKSQTITNLIASVIASGKSVLFVAEKSAALEVVKRRLEKIGLAEFCLELHSHRKQKRELLSGLEHRLALKGSFPKPANLEYKRKQADEAKTRLNNYAKLLNTAVRDLETTPFEAIWARHKAIENLPFSEDLVSEINIADNESLSKVAYEKTTQDLNLFALLARELLSEFARIEDHPWYGVNADSLSYGEQASVIELCRTASQAATAATSLCQSLRERHIALASTLQDFQYCLAVRDSIPGSAPASLNGFAQILKRPDGSAALEQVCLLVEKWRTTLAEIHSLVSCNSTTEICYESAKELLGIVSDLRIGEYAVNELRLVWETVETLIRGIESASPLFVWAQQKLAISVPDTKEGVTRVSAVLHAVEEAPIADIRNNKNSILLEDDASAVLKKALEDSEKLNSIRSSLENRYDLSSLPDFSALRGHAEALLDSNLFTRFLRSDCRQAKRAYRRLLRQPMNVPYTEIISTFRLLADYSDKRQKFLKNQRYSALAGDTYDAEHTAWRPLIRVADWLANARAQFGVGSDDLLKWLASLPKVDIEAIRAELVQRRPQIEAIELLTSEAESKLRKLPTGLEVSWDDSISALKVRLSSSQEVLKRILALSDRSQIIGSLRLASLHRLMELLGEESAIHREADELATRIGLSDCYRGRDTRTQDILDCLNFAAALRTSHLPTALSDWLIESYDSNRERLLASLDQYLTQLSIIQNKLTSLIQLASLSTEEFLGGNADIFSTGLDRIIKRLGSAVDAKQSLTGFVDFIRSRNQFSRTGHPLLAKLVEQRMLNPDHLRSAYDYVFFSSVAQLCTGNSLDLASFNGIAHQRVRERFSELDREIMRLNAQYAAALVDERLVHHGSRSGPVGQWTGLALLEHEIGKQKRHIPIRQLVNRAGSALKSLKPCFMMSPLSVAQYLEPGQVSFDLVVMDEASQLRPEDALGAIARSTQVVIVGDPKQLPPTSFFEALSADSETDPDLLSAAEDAESILDVASSVFPAKRLRWHYRSRHQSLIHFSNTEFYKNLMIFPSPHFSDEKLGVKFVPVPHGKFVNRRNTEEAQAVVAAVLAHIRKCPNESLGIVTLNYEQRELISDLLDREFLSDPFADAYLANWQERSEPLFVKNLENVQGDERDVMFVSVTYGPDEKGNQFQRFGPINGPEGHRRLNVLFTRAKNRVVVFSSLDTSKIVVEGHSSWGLKVLKKYLEFARTGEIPELMTKGGAPESDFEVSVGDVVKAAGFDLEFQVGVAGFFIDIGVLDPAKPGQFLAGIECDGAAYHSAKSARDRDRLRQQILEDHHWNIYRIWSTDWFKNRQSEKARLVSFLNSFGPAQTPSKSTRVP